jgi:hypothetical protein
MNPSAYIVAKAGHRFQNHHPELAGLAVESMQTLRSELLADLNFAPMFKAEVATGGPHIDAMKWLEGKIVSNGGNIP